MPIASPIFSNSFDRIRGMRTADLGTLFNDAVVGPGNQLLSFLPPPVPDAGSPEFKPATVAREPEPTAPNYLTTSRQEDRFQRPVAMPRADATTPSEAVSSPQDLMSLVKEFEGFNPSAYADYKQTSIGYGTRAKSGERTISRAEAERRLAEEVGASRQRVLSHAETYGYAFSEKQLDALASFDYNTGRLNQLTAKGTRTPEEIATKMLEYNKAGGKVLPGLTRRRTAESKLFQTP